MSRKVLSLCCLLLIIVLVSYLGYHSAVSTTEIESEDDLDGAIPFLGPIDMLDRETAAKYGISGYVSIEAAPLTPRQLYLSNSEASVTLLVKFVSFREDFAEADVTFGSGRVGLTTEVTYGDRLLCLNDLVSYEPSGTVKVKAGEVLRVKMTIKVPADYPHVSFPLGAVGVTSNAFISDRVDVIASV